MDVDEAVTRVFFYTQYVRANRAESAINLHNTPYPQLMSSEGSAVPCLGLSWGRRPTPPPERSRWKPVSALCIRTLGSTLCHPSTPQTTCSWRNWPDSWWTSLMWKRNKINGGKHTHTNKNNTLLWLHWPDAPVLMDIITSQLLYLVTSPPTSDL